MVKRFSALIFIVFLSFLHSCNKSEIEDIKNRLDKIEKSSIATITTQIDNIKTSINDLTNLKSSLESTIDNLQDKIEKLQKDLESQQDSESETTQSIKDEISKINSLITELQRNWDKTNNLISQLQSYINEEIGSIKTWATATFATLNHYEVIQSEIASLRLYIEDHESLIDKSFQTEITNAIKSCENSMKDWVNQLLADGYYDIATIDALLKSLESKIVAAEEIYSDKIEKQREDLEQAKQNLTDAYNKAIYEAIEEHNGHINEEINNRITIANKELKDQINTIKKEVDILKERLLALEEIFSNRIQSIKYIPEYSDNKAKYDLSTNTIILNFLVSPSQLAKSIKSAWDLDSSIVNSYLIYTKDPSTRAIGPSYKQKINSIEANEDGLLTILVQVESPSPEFLTGKDAGLMYIQISDGNNDIVSELIPIYVKEYFPIDFTINSSAFIANLKGHIDILTADLPFCSVEVYYSDDESISIKDWQYSYAEKIDESHNFSITLTNLRYNTKYYYVVKATLKSGERIYSDTHSFITSNLDIQLGAKINPSVHSYSDVEFVTYVSGLSDEELDNIEFGIAYSQSLNDFDTRDYSTMHSKNLYSYCKFSNSILLRKDSKYYYKLYVYSQDWGIHSTYGEIQELSISQHPYTIETPLNISQATEISNNSANSYIISEPGIYKFKTVKGNSDISVGNVSSSSILWETYGTKEIPKPCDLINAVYYENGYIAFQTNEVFKEGNAVIAAKDANGNILWSWHIWLTDQPRGQLYHNQAKLVMDRNLGATSAVPGDIGAWGLYYQWGRKDPYLCASDILNDSHYCTIAESTITWDKVVLGSVDLINESIKSPITYFASWGRTNEVLWTTSETEKSIYDPCPPGWRVPDGNNTWQNIVDNRINEDKARMGYNLGGIIGDDITIWYPNSGSRTYGPDISQGPPQLWTSSLYNNGAYQISISNSKVSLLKNPAKYRGYPIRCIQE